MLNVDRDAITLNISSPADGIERLTRFTPSEWSRLIAPETRSVERTVA